MKLIAVLLAAAALAATTSVTTLAGDSECGPKDNGNNCVPAEGAVAIKWWPAPVVLGPVLAPQTDGGFQPQVPCSDPDGCPDITVDETAMTPSIDYFQGGVNSCSVVEGEVSGPGARLLRFRFISPNEGLGDLHVGRPADHPEWFNFPTCHGHFHFKEYADYRLWTVPGYLQWTLLRLQDPDTLPGDLINEHPELQLQLLRGDKRGFCVIDLVNYIPGMPQNHRSCGNNQGISVGWADVYERGLSGQWVEITGILPGFYVLEAEVNAERLYEESNYANNAAAILVQIPAG